jgi:hypothetical protein
LLLSVFCLHKQLITGHVLLLLVRINSLFLFNNCSTIKLFLCLSATWPHFFINEILLLIFRAAISIVENVVRTFIRVQWQLIILVFLTTLII